MMSCPAPIGAVPREDCADIADDFGALTVQGALPLAGAGRFAEQRQEAIRAVAALAQSIKEQRVRLCEAYVHCKVPVAERDAQDQVLAGAMRSLIDLWNKRRLASLDEVTRFREAVRVLDQRVGGAGGGEAGPQAPGPPRTLRAEEALGRVEDPGVGFRAEAGAVTVTATAAGKHDALLSKADGLSLPAGHRYRLEVSGVYRPAAPPLVQPGDELLARVAYRAEGAATLQLALRSLEDPEAAETTDSFSAAGGAKGSHESSLAAQPLQTGFYLGVTVKGAPVELSGIELLRGGKVIATGRAGEPGTWTDCAPVKAAGHDARALRCPPGEGDRVTLGQPESYLVLGLRDAAGLRASTRTLSLEGGRSVDALVGEGAQLVVTLVGPGSATVDRIQVTDLGL